MGNDTVTPVAFQCVDGPFAGQRIMPLVVDEGVKHPVILMRKTGGTLPQVEVCVYVLRRDPVVEPLHGEGLWQWHYHEQEGE